MFYKFMTSGAIHYMDPIHKTIKRSLSLFRRHSKKFVVASSGCWNWTAMLNRGYGMIGQDGSLRLAHRVSWVLYKGPIPDGKLVLHKCNNPKCVNPRHLYIGTAKDNTRDTIRYAKKHGGRPLGQPQRIDDTDVVEIRSLAADNVPTKNIAAEYGITQGYVRDIVTKRCRASA